MGYLVARILQVVHPSSLEVSTVDVRRTREWRELVRWAKYNLPWICHLCGQRIPTWAGRFHPLSYALDHKLTVRDHPELGLSKGNVAPSHKRCNDARKARPLTPGLVLEFTEKYANRKPAALDFFDSNEETLDNPGAGPVKSPQPQLPPVTVTLASASPRSLRVVDDASTIVTDGPVTHNGHGRLS